MSLKKILEMPVEELIKNPPKISEYVPPQDLPKVDFSKMAGLCNHMAPLYDSFERKKKGLFYSERRIVPLSYKAAKKILRLLNKIDNR